MHTITKYVSNDGYEFSTQEKAEKHELLNRIVDDLLSNFPKLPENSNFSNGIGYIQHYKETFLSIRHMILVLAKSNGADHKWIDQSIDDSTVDASWAGRIIDESCPRPINRAWYRISCVDNQFREWGQIYYKNNPPAHTEQICLNPEKLNHGFHS